MKISLLFIFLTSLCHAAQDNAVVKFKNGDKLSGSAVSLNLETLTWESALLKDQAKFNLDQIVELQLPSKIDNESMQGAGHEAVLELTNGDSVRGVLTGLNEKEVVLKTWYAGELHFRRLNVKSVDITRNTKVLYRGPSGLDGWTVGGDENSWIYENNELGSKATGFIARNIDYTDSVKFTYDAAWKGPLKYKVILFASDITTATPNSGYEIYFQGSIIQVRRLSDNGRLGGRMISRRGQVEDAASIEIRISKKSKSISVYVDEEQYGVWQDEALGNVDGKGLTFVSENGYDVGISNILVSEWDGIVEDTEDDDMRFRDPRFGNMGFNGRMQLQAPEPKELPEGRMSLANGDTIEGEVMGIKDELIKIKTPYAEVALPVSRMNNISLKNPSAETPRRENGDVRAVLADGSKLVFRLDDVKDGKLFGYSQNFGRAEFLQSAFKSIEFNLYPKPKLR